MMKLTTIPVAALVALLGTTDGFFIITPPPPPPPPVVLPPFANPSMVSGGANGTVLIAGNSTSQTSVVQAEAEGSASGTNTTSLNNGTASLERVQTADGTFQSGTGVGISLQNSMPSIFSGPGNATGTGTAGVTSVTSLDAGGFPVQTTVVSGGGSGSSSGDGSSSSSGGATFQQNITADAIIQNSDANANVDLMTGR